MEAQFVDDVEFSAQAHAQRLQQFCYKIEKLNKQWKVQMNLHKSKLVKFKYKRNTTYYPVALGSTIIRVAQSVRYLGSILNPKLPWNLHITNTLKNST